MSSATMEIVWRFLKKKKNLRINILKEKHPDSPWGPGKLHVPRLPLAIQTSVSEESQRCFSRRPGKPQGGIIAFPRQMCSHHLGTRFKTLVSTATAIQRIRSSGEGAGIAFFSRPWATLHFEDHSC